MVVFENRASYILYNIIMSTDLSKKIIIPANVCPIVIAIMLKAKKNIELVDISPINYHIDTDKTLQLVNDSKDSYDSLLFVRAYGADLDFNNFFDKLKKIKNDLFIIDDKCLAIPEFEPDLSKKVDVTVFSTGYAKYIELGFGGYAFIKDAFPYLRVNLPYNNIDHTELTNNFKEVINCYKQFNYKESNWLDSNHLSVQISDYYQMISKQISKVYEHKKKINRVYSDYLPNEIVMESHFNYWRFNILVNNKEHLLSKIFENRLFASSHYSPINMFLRAGNYEVAENIYGNVLNLFNDFRFDENMAYRTAKIISSNL